MDVLEELLARYDGWFAALEWIALGFIGLALFEAVADILLKTGRRFSETAANVMVAVGYEFVGYFVGAVALLITYYFVAPFALFEIEMTPLAWAGAFVMADFLYYWMHRTEHEVRFFWAYHVTHHSSPEYDLTTAFRLNWIEGLFEWIFLVPMLIIGFDPVAVLVAIAVNATYQTWIHTQKVGKLGWLDKVINTPSAHRVHHGSNPKYLDKNYGGVLLLWDHLFGTYQAEEEQVTFGITDPVGSINPFVINFHEYGAIMRDVWRARCWNDRWRYLFGHPGWKAGPDTTMKQEGQAHAAHQRPGA